MNTDTLFCLLIFVEYALLLLDDNVDDECEELESSKSSVSGCCVGFA